MRKLVTLLVILFAFVTMEAQMLTTSLRPGETFKQVTTDYTLTSTTASYWQVNTQLDSQLAQAWVVHMDSATGNHTNVALQLYGRVCSLDAWATIGSAINWLGGIDGDTTISYINDTENEYRQFKLLYTGTGTGTTTISEQAFKVYKGTP